MSSIHTLIHRLHNPDVGILFIRIALGIVFLHAGLLKMTDMNIVIAGFGAVGIPAQLAYVVAYAELLSGLVLILGIFARYAGIVLATIMLVAIAKVHFMNGFGLQNGGYEYAFVLLLASLAMIVMGSGKYSLAHMLKQRM